MSARIYITCYQAGPPRILSYQLGPRITPAMLGPYSISQFRSKLRSFGPNLSHFDLNLDHFQLVFNYFLVKNLGLTYVGLDLGQKSKIVGLSHPIEYGPRPKI